MDVRTKTTKLLTIALAAAVMTVGSMGARATLIGGDQIRGCLLANFTGGLGAMATACANPNNTSQWAANADVGAATEFSFTVNNWLLKVDFGEDGQTLLSITNNGAARAVAQNTHMLFGDLDFAGGATFAEHPFVDVKVSDVKKIGTTTGPTYDQASDLLTLPVDYGTDANGEWYHIAFNNAATFAAGQTVYLSATLNTVPEPGSLALLGLVLLAIGLANIKRLRRLGVRSASRVAA